MNVYDFDRTIYNGDSTIDFYVYALKHKPAILKYLPKQCLGFILYALKRIDKTKLKEYYFCFLPAINAKKMTTSFWEQNQHKIYKWYHNQQMPDDIIISASPEFLLKPVCQHIGVKHLIATKVDINSGMFIGENCRGAEKVRRLKKEYNITHIDKFYSDSLSDLPLASMANEAFLIKKGTMEKWQIQRENEAPKCNL